MNAGMLSPDEYEKLSGISKHEYEQRVLGAVQQWFLDRESVPDDMGKVESVSLVGEGASTKIVMIFRVANRGLHRLFGWRIAIWPASRWTDPEERTPEFFAGQFPMYMDEAINTIPFHMQIQPQDDEGIEWVEDDDWDDDW